MRTIGVAGTSGKTTVAWLVREMMEEADQVTGRCRGGWQLLGRCLAAVKQLGRRCMEGVRQQGLPRRAGSGWP